MAQLEANIQAAMPPTEGAAPSVPPGAVPAPEHGNGDEPVADAPPFLSPLSKGECPNKTRKGNEGKPLPGAPDQLSEEQKQLLEEEGAEQAKQQALEHQRQVDAHLAGMLEQARRNSVEKDDGEGL